MSVEQYGPFRMPQPEQWLHEHHVDDIFVGLVVVGSLVTVVYALAYLIWMAA